MKLDTTTHEIPPPKSRHGVHDVEDDELHPLTRARSVDSVPPPLPGRRDVIALSEVTLVVRDEELRPLTHAQWLEAKKKRSARRPRKAQPQRLAG
jgi:hypothetical protein